MDNRLSESRTLVNRAVHRKGQNSNQVLKLLHQNIRGLRGKASELLCQLHQDLPHILCPSEHHLSQSEVDLTNIENYVLGAKYCRKKLQRAGVSTFIQSHFQFTALNLDKYCVDQDIKVCALKLDSTFLNICILVIYRSPLGNFNRFVTQLDKILHKLCTIKSNLIICGDVNVNYLQESNRKSQLSMLLNSYYLFSTVQFPTRTYKNSISAIDNICIDTTKIDTYEVTPVINGLSDHDAQFLKININFKHFR
jgi:exonuclease III